MDKQLKRVSKVVGNERFHFSATPNMRQKARMQKVKWHG